MSLNSADIGNGETWVQGEDGQRKMEAHLVNDGGTCKKNLTIPVEVMSEYVELQSLLCSLTIEYIRRDFLDGDIVNVEQPELVLFTIDRMRELLMPAWSSSAKVRQGMASCVVQHMKSLVVGEPQIFNIPAGEVCVYQQSYGEWRKLFRELYHSTYWESFPDADHLQLRVVKKQDMHESKEKTTRCKVKQEERAQRARQWVRDESHLGKHQNEQRFLNIEEIDLGDSDDCSSESDISEISVRRSRHNRAREVVTPPKFSLESTQSLRKYLEVYEIF